MRSGYDPTRRNRNLGTSRAGHGSDNKHVIPQSWHESRVYWEKLRDPIIVERLLYSSPITFFVEPPREDCAHACTVDDVMAVLKLLPREHQLLVKTFVFRQPTRKQELLNSCWGRWVYFVELGKYKGVAVYLDAQNPNKPLLWDKAQDPLGHEELERLRTDGHQVTRHKRHWEIGTSLETNRNTQLYRTLPHEIGHNVHFVADRDAGIDHWARPVAEREQFAHRYADEFRQQTIRLHLLPFPRQLNHHRLAGDGLRPSWFGC